MESTNNNSNQMFLSVFKELRKEISAVKNRIVQLEESHEKQQERIDILERENHTLKTELNNINGNKPVGSVLKRKRTDQVQAHEEITARKKKPKTKNNNNNYDDEAVVIPQHDNGDSFDSLSDDLLHKILKFDGNCYSKFGSINKRCRNIYDVKEYKLKKQTCLFGYGTIDMMLQHYLQKRRERSLHYRARLNIARTVFWYNRLDAIDWIIQLGDSKLLKYVCCFAAFYGKINILTNVFLKSNVEMLDQLLNCAGLCNSAVNNGKLETLKFLRKYGVKWNTLTLDAARENGDDEMVQYLRAEGCPEPPEDRDESSGSEQLGSDPWSDDDDGDY